MTDEFRMRTALVKALLACSSVAHPGSRETIIDHLPAEVKNSVRRDASAHTDVTNLVNAALNYANGLTGLVEAVRYIEGDSLPMCEVDRIVAEWHPALHPSPPIPDPAPTPSTTLSYERGLERLAQRLARADARTQQDFAVLRVKLDDNLSRAKQAGLTSELRDNRNQIIEHLNRLARDWGDEDFEKLSQ